MHPKNQTRYRSLNRIAADPRVLLVWDEGDDGIWVDLVDGWESYLGDSCVHEWTLAEVIRSFRWIQKSY